MTGDLTAGRLASAGDRPGSPVVPAGPLVNRATDELAAALTVLAGGCPCWSRGRCRASGTPGSAVIPTTEENTPTGARENIHRHYDLSNELFETVPRPDPDLLRRAGSSPGDDLLAAQQRKIDGILDLARRQARDAGAGDRFRLGRARDAGRAASGTSRSPR